VYAGQYAAGAATLANVRLTGPYALEQSFDRVWTGYSDYTNGKETILAYQASANDGDPGGDNANQGERLNFPNGGHFGCCGFNQPTQNLVNYFRVDAAGLPLALSSPNTWNANDNNFTAADKLPVDPRLDWTVGREGVPLKDWGLYTVAAYARDLPNGGPYSPKKNIHEKSSGSELLTGGWAPTQQNDVNIHLYRFADALLLEAEALVETGNLALATQLVNMVRARAGVTAQGPGTGRADLAVPIHDPSITWAVYNVQPYPTTFASQAFGREAVRAERRLELAMEGQRFFDIRRWGIGATVINGYLTGVGGGREDTRRLYLAKAEPFTARHNLFPIPTLQIDLSKVGTESRLAQNPGW
jgi:hypothetical protein